MNKTANASWPELLLGGGAVGAGTFALGRLLQELQQDRPGGLSLPETLTLDLPRQAQKEEEAKQLQAGMPLPPTMPGMKLAGDVVSGALGLLGGAPIGYMGTKFLYDAYKKRQMKEKIDQANQMYLATLQAAQQAKLGADANSTTPHVDQFCGAVAVEVEKHANLMNSARQFMTNKIMPHAFTATTAGLGATPFLAGLKQTATANSPEGFAPVSAMKEGTSDWMTVASLLGSLLVGGGLIHAAGKRQSKDARRLPTGVAINYPTVNPSLE